MIYHTVLITIILSYYLIHPKDLVTDKHDFKSANHCLPSNADNQSEQSFHSLTGNKNRTSVYLFYRQPIKTEITKF